MLAAVLLPRNLSIAIGVRANFFLGAWPSHLYPKNCYANLHNCFARLTPPTNYFGHFISLDRMNSVLINTIFFHFGLWLLPKKFSICQKNNTTQGVQPPSLPGSYACVNHTLLSVKWCFVVIHSVSRENNWFLLVLWHRKNYIQQFL